MKNTSQNKSDSYENYLEEQLKDPRFRKAWKETELEYLIARQIIDRRIQQRISQRDLAKKLNTSQAVIARLEGMTGNPTLKLLKKVASALGKKLEVRFV